MSHDKTSSKFSGEEKLLNSRLPPTIYTKILHCNTHLDTRCEVFFDECKRTLNFCRSSWFVWNFLDCTYSLHNLHISKLMFSKKATKMMKSSPSIWCLLSKCQPDGKDFFHFLLPSYKTWTLPADHFGHFSESKPNTLKQAVNCWFLTLLSLLVHSRKAAPNFLLSTNERESV